MAGQAIILEKNPNYNVTPNQPAFDTVTFKIVGETNQMLTQVQVGAIDVASADPNQMPQLETIDASGKIKIYNTPTTAWEHIDINLDNPLFQDVNVRHAIAYAINRQQIVDNLEFGKTVVAHTWITPNIVPYFASDVPKYEYNPDKARQLLAAAGYTMGADGILTGPGGKMSFTYTTTAGSVLRQSVTQLVAADLKAVGIDAQVIYIPANILFADDGPLQRRTFAFAEYTWVSTTDPGCGLYQSSGIPTAQNNYSGQNYPGWRNAQNDALFDQICNDASIALDPVKRAPVYRAEQRIFAEQLPTLPLFVRLGVSVVPIGLHNYRPTGSIVPADWNIQEWRWSRLGRSVPAKWMPAMQGLIRVRGWHDVLWVRPYRKLVIVFLPPALNLLALAPAHNQSPAPSSWPRPRPRRRRTLPRLAKRGRQPKPLPSAELDCAIALRHRY